MLNIFKRKPKILIHSLEELEWFKDTNPYHKMDISILSLGKGYSVKIEDNTACSRYRYVVWVKCRGVMVSDFPGINFGLYCCKYKSEVVKYVNYVYNQIIINKL